MSQENSETLEENTLIDEEESETVCYCFDVPENIIRKVIKEHRLKEVDAVTEICNAGGGCTSCHPDIEELIDEIWTEELEE